MHVTVRTNGGAIVRGLTAKDFEVFDNGSRRQILKDISNSIEPKLKDLNQKWYTLKTSSELAGMDQFSGEKLKAAAEALKRQQKGITPSTTRGFRGGGL